MRVSKAVVKRKASWEELAYELRCSGPSDFMQVSPIQELHMQELSCYYKTVSFQPCRISRLIFQFWRAKEKRTAAGISIGREI